MMVGDIFCLVLFPLLVLSVHIQGCRCLKDGTEGELELLLLLLLLLLLPIDAAFIMIV